MSLIESRLEGHIGTLVMNHPEHRNALSAALIEEMIEAFESMQRDRARVVVLRAYEGARVWSAGHDVRELPHPGRDPLAYDDPLVRVLRTVQYLPIPVVAMIDGSVWGGACDLALSCDLLLGSPNAKFTMTPAKIGVPYNASGILHFMNTLGVNTAKEMFFTARPVEAQHALEVGLLNHLVPNEVLESFTYDIAQQITRNSPLSIAAIKEQIRLLAGASPLSPLMFERIQGLRQQVFESRDYEEGIQAFLEKRSPHYLGE